MSIYDTRRSNLTRLTANLGAKQALAMKLDMTPPQVSHWLREPHRTGTVDGAMLASLITLAG